MRVTAHDDCRVSPFGHPRITARLTTPRGLSRPPTSFIGSWYQGIHRAPLITWPQMLASTMQFSNNEPSPTPHTPTQTVRDQRARQQKGKNPTHKEQGPFPQDPTACPTQPPDTDSLPHPAHSGAVLTIHTQQPSRIANVPPMSNHSRTHARSWHMLLRKEVIQPHLPVRLPCYDFVPIASPTFDDSLPQRVGPPASGVTDFRDVTGGVYKARERIHRSTADLRLLETPTSWGRVADPNPN